MLWLEVEIFAGRALRERQCTLEGEAPYVNVHSNVQCSRMHTGDANYFN